MFTTEIRINGDLIGHVYCHNKGQVKNILPEKQQYRYEYLYYDVELKKLTSGEIFHVRENGIRKLICLILQDVDKKNKR